MTDLSPLRELASDYRRREATCWDIAGTARAFDYARLIAKANTWATAARELEQLILRLETAGEGG